MDEKIIQIVAINNQILYLTSKGRVIEYCPIKNSHRKVFHKAKKSFMDFLLGIDNSYYTDEYDYAWQDVSPDLTKVEKYEK